MKKLKVKGKFKKEGPRAARGWDSTSTALTGVAFMRGQSSRGQELRGTLGSTGAGRGEVEALGGEVIGQMRSWV